jgi:3'-phosphoadenosine 5'-phosphosulfate sulfotransferase (PAPS reductase)/FAD synthetase
VRYIQLVKRWGFPGPAGHQLMYRRLKDRCVYMLTNEHKAHRLQRIGLCTGLRRSESQRRMGYTNAVQRHRSQIWVNPIFHWEDADLDAYRDRYALPEGPVSAYMGMSGECFCGAYGGRSPGRWTSNPFVPPATCDTSQGGRHCST